jgi:para-nitrobenzyl esterase
MRRIVHTALFAASVLLAIAAAAQAQPVKTDGGLVEGTAANGVTAYKGIPLAAPPVGDLRWRAPQPPAPWQGVHKADAFGPACPQDQSFNKFIGLPELPTSEDCLYLNVWTPAKSAGAKLPVMVWIYWIDFAKSGDPNGGGMPSWPAYSDTKPSVMKLDVTPAPITLPEKTRIKVLDDYYAWRRERAK